MFDHFVKLVLKGLGKAMALQSGHNDVVSIKLMRFHGNALIHPLLMFVKLGFQIQVRKLVMSSKEHSIKH